MNKIKLSKRIYYPPCKGKEIGTTGDSICEYMYGESIGCFNCVANIHKRGQLDPRTNEPFFNKDDLPW